MSKRLRVLLAAFAVALACASAAEAHQTAVNNGVAVTMHVSPDDEPRAGHPAQVLVTKVKPRTGVFAWTTCRCALVISDSATTTLFKGTVKPQTEFTFPEVGAYQLDFSGRVKRKGKWVQFKVSFAIRAY